MQAQRGRRRCERRAAVDLGAALARDEGLDDAILQRMEARSRRRRPPSGEQVHRRLQNLFELLKFGIDENPKSLKGARCRVLVRLPRLDRTSHDGGQLASGSHGMAAFPASNKRLCNRYSKPLFAVVTYHLRNLALVGAGEKVRRGLAAEAWCPCACRAGRLEAEAENHALGACRSAARTRPGRAAGRRSSRCPDRRAPPGSCAKLAWTISKRASEIASGPCRAAATATGSLSMPITRASGPRRFNSSRVCPPRPKVPST